MEIKHIESVVKIYFTREYGSFKWLKGNRELNEVKVKKIMKAVKGGIDVLRFSPIIVNENMEIIDGQHRFMVCKQLKENVHYVISRDSDLSIVPGINSNSSNWKKVDYLNSYCDMKKPAYLEVRNLVDSYPGLNITTAASMVFSGLSSSKEFMDHFTEGTLTADFLDHTIKITELLNDFAPHTKNPFSRRFYNVMEQLHENGKYDHSQMLVKLNESGRRIEDLNSTKTIMMEMESIYNHRLRTRALIN